MDESKSELGGEKGSSSPSGEYEEIERLGDIAMCLGMAPNGGFVEMALTDTALVRFAGRFAYRGRSNDGRMTTRYADTVMGHSEVATVGIYKNLPKQ